MKILSSDFKSGQIKLKIENMDDLWYLSQIIDEDDLVSGSTYRKIKIDSSERSQKISRKRIFLKIKVEKIEFSEHTDSLRVNGTVIDGPEDVPRGSYHTFSLEEDTMFTLEKEVFLKYQIDKLNQAQKKKNDILVCIFDREESLFAILEAKGFRVLSQLSGDVIKKGDPDSKGKNFYRQILDKLKDYLERYKVNHIILASPAFWKDELAKELKDDDLKKKTVFATCSSVTKEAINEILKRPEIKNILKQDRLAVETGLIDKLLEEISKQGLATYGIKETSAAIEAGAVSILLVTDALIKTRRAKNSFQEIDSLMKKVDSAKGDIHILNSSEEPGRKLDGLGGMAAILRYRLN